MSTVVHLEHVSSSSEDFFWVPGEVKMTVDQFQIRWSRVQVHPNDLKWMPCWLKEFANLRGYVAGSR